MRLLRRHQTLMRRRRLNGGRNLKSPAILRSNVCYYSLPFFGLPFVRKKTRLKCTSNSPKGFTISRPSSDPRFICIQGHASTYMDSQLTRIEGCFIDFKTSARHRLACEQFFLWFNEGSEYKQCEYVCLQLGPPTVIPDSQPVKFKTEPRKIGV